MTQTYRVKVRREPLMVDLEANSEAEAIEEVLRKRPHYKDDILGAELLHKEGQ